MASSEKTKSKPGETTAENKINVVGCGERIKAGVYEPPVEPLSESRRDQRFVSYRQESVEMRRPVRWLHSIQMDSLPTTDEAH